MGAGYPGIDMEKIRREVSDEMINDIIDKESIEYSELEQKRNRLLDEQYIIFKEAEETPDDDLVDLAKKQEKRLLKINAQLSAIRDKMERIQIEAYQEIKKRWNKEIREKKV